MKLYTKAGDSGRASTMTRRSIPKDSPIFELLGTLDEFSSSMGVAKQSAPDKRVLELIETLQQDIIKLCGELAGYEKFATADRVRELENAIDALMETVPEFSGFVLPGKSPCGAALDVARTIARRAERKAVAMATPEITAKACCLREIAMMPAMPPKNAMNTSKMVGVVRASSSERASLSGEMKK